MLHLTTRSSLLKNATGIIELSTFFDRGQSDFVDDNVQSDAVWYTLDGRRLNAQPVQKGLYIVNGRKVVIK